MTMPDWDRIADDLIEKVSVLPGDRDTMNMAWNAMLTAKDQEDQLQQVENLAGDLRVENILLRERLASSERYHQIALDRMRSVAAANQLVLRALEAWSDRVPYVLLRRVRSILTEINTAPAVNAIRAEEAARIASTMLRSEDEKGYVFRRAARWLEGKQK